MDGSANNISFSLWQSTYGFDLNALNGVNPLFVDPLNGNFRLQSSSPALTLGRDILDLNSNGSTTDVIPAGAYITGTETIGLLSVAVSPTAQPIAPRNLRIIL